MTLTLLPSEFLYVRRNFLFFFISASAASLVLTIHILYGRLLCFFSLINPMYSYNFLTSLSIIVCHTSSLKMNTPVFFYRFIAAVLTYGLASSRRAADVEGNGSHHGHKTAIKQAHDATKYQEGLNINEIRTQKKRVQGQFTAMLVL
jgi:hypothetical protein